MNDLFVLSFLFFFLMRGFFLSVFPFSHSRHFKNFEVRDFLTSIDFFRRAIDLS